MKRVFSPKDIVSSGLCIGCGICVALENGNGAGMKFDLFGQLKPTGPSGWYNKGSEDFSNVCPFSPSAVNENLLSSELFADSSERNISIGSFRDNYVGYASESDYRMNGSSGGMVSWVASELLKRNLVDGVAHVIAAEDPQNEGTYFRYRISRSIEEIHAGARSRYYPVELSGILKMIRDIPGRYAIVAVPCMIKAVQLLRRNDPVFHDRISYTLGLFCGHMKSARFVESFAWQMKVPVIEIKQVEFRHKYPDRPASWYNARLELKDGRTVNRDWWHLVDGDWGAGYFMNSACNYCDDVVAETADISFGDAWVEPYSSDGRGTNVIIIRSPEIHDMILSALSDGRLDLKEVSAGFVEQTQAAGLRQRREGLAFRLTWSKNGVRLVKRVLPDSEMLSKERKKIYRTRYRISKWSHRMFWLARKMNFPFIYLFWGRATAALYYGIAYHKGSLGQMKKRFRQLGSQRSQRLH